MRLFTLAITAADLPGNSACAIWQGREAPDGVLLLETMLEEKLVEIRSRHMAWAFEMGAREGFDKILQCGDSPSMWWTSLIYERHPKVCPELYPIYKLACVEIWLKEGRAEALLLKGGSSKLKKCLASLCQNMGIGFQAEAGAMEKDQAEIGWKRKIYNALPAFFRCQGRLAFWLWRIRRLLPQVKNLPGLPKTSQGLENWNKAATIATYFPNIDDQAAGEGRFRSRYWESLHDALNGEARRERPDGPHFVRWLFLYFNSPGISLKDAVRLRDSFQKNGGDGLSFNFLEEFLSWGDIGRAYWRFLKLCGQSLIYQKKFANACALSGSKLNFWPYMRWQWAESLRGWRCLERCLFNVAFERYCRLAGPQRWTFFPLENCPWERMLTEACREVKGNGPVFGAQHSTIRPTDFRYFDDSRTFEYKNCARFQPDIIAGNGAEACGQWRANGMPKARLAQVEALRYLYLAGLVFEGGKCETEPEAGEPLEQCGKKRLLIATSFFRDETAAHLALVKAALMAGLLDNWFITLKAHPYLHPWQWLDSLGEKERKRIYVSGQPMSRELAPGTSVWASNSTTVALEAALAGLPLMVMAASNDFDLSPVQGAPGLLRVATVADVEAALGKLAPPRLAPDYLDLNPLLPKWRRLLELEGPAGNMGIQGKIMNNITI